MDFNNKYSDCRHSNNKMDSLVQYEPLETVLQRRHLDFVDVCERRHLDATKLTTDNSLYFANIHEINSADLHKLIELGKSDDDSEDDCKDYSEDFSIRADKALYKRKKIRTTESFSSDSFCFKLFDDEQVNISETGDLLERHASLVQSERSDLKRSRSFSPSEASESKRRALTDNYTLSCLLENDFSYGKRKTSKMLSSHTLSDLSDTDFTNVHELTDGFSKTSDVTTIFDITKNRKSSAFSVPIPLLKHSFDQYQDEFELSNDTFFQTSQGMVGKSFSELLAELSQPKVRSQTQQSKSVPEQTDDFDSLCQSMKEDLKKVEFFTSQISNCNGSQIFKSVSQSQQEMVQVQNNSQNEEFIDTLRLKHNISKAAQENRGVWERNALKKQADDAGDTRFFNADIFEALPTVVKRFQEERQTCDEVEVSSDKGKR